MNKCPKCGSENVERVEHGTVHGAVLYCQADNCSFYWIPSQQSEISILTAQIQEKDSLIVFLRKNLSDRASLQCDSFDAVQVENSAQAKRIEKLEEGLRKNQHTQIERLRVITIRCNGCGSETIRMKEDPEASFSKPDCKPDCWLAKLLEGK
jgi:hypothetical protein